MGDFSINGTHNWDLVTKSAIETFKPTYLLADSRASMIDSDYCRCFFQEIKLPRFSLWVSEYRALQAARLQAVVDRPVLELHGMLRGGMNYATEAFGHVQMPPYTFNLCQQPYVVNQVALPPAAHVITFDVLFQPDYLQELCLHYADLNPFMEKFFNQQACLLPHQALPQNKSLSGVIQYVLHAPSRPHLQQVLLARAIETYVMDSLYYLTHEHQKPLHATTFERKAVQDVRKYIQDKPDDHSTILGLAKRFAINSNQLKRLFKAENGLTILEFRTRERMNWACVLLREGESVERTAFAVGYTNPSAFIHRFKQVFLLSPLHYQKRR